MRILRTAVLPACLMLAVPAAWGAGNLVTTTNSQAEVDTLNTTSVTQRVDTYSVELKARMQGGAFLYDHTFQVQFSDPSVQAAITTAQGVLTGAGAKSFTGPTQLSSAVSQVSSVTNTVQTGTQTTQTYVGTGAWNGPVTFSSGNLGICQSYALANGSNNPAGLFSVTGNYAILTGCSGGTPTPVVSGGINFDVLAAALVTISQTASTTNTFLTTQVYELDGFPQTTPPVTPAPPSLLLLFTALAAAAFYLNSRKSSRAS